MALADHLNHLDTGGLDRPPLPNEARKRYVLILLWRCFLLIGLLASGLSMTRGCAYAAGLDSAPASPAASSLDEPREIGTVAAGNIAKPIHIVTWNIDRGRNLGAITRYLAGEHADLVLLQEADWNTRRTGWKDVSAELAKQLSFNAFYGIEFEELGQEGRQHHSALFEELGQEGRQHHPAFIGQATLTALPVSKTRILRFKCQSPYWKQRVWLPSSWSFLQRRRGGRIALVTELDVSGRLLVVYNVHLENVSALDLIQARQINEVLKDVDKYPRGTGVIIAGDMNTEFFPTVFRKRLEKRGFRSAMGNKLRATELGMLALDWIFVRGSVVLDHGRICRKFRGSDHVAVAATITVR